MASKNAVSKDATFDLLASGVVSGGIDMTAPMEAGADVSGVRRKVLEGGSREGVEQGASKFVPSKGKNSLGGAKNRSRVPRDYRVVWFYHGESAIIAVLLSDDGRALRWECARNTKFRKAVLRRN